MVSVIVPTTGNLSSLSRLARSLQKQECSQPVEILFVCNPPKQELESHFQDFPNVSFCHSKVLGSNHARNIGIEKSRGELCLFIDDDCETEDPLFLEKHIRTHQEHPNVTAIGGNYVFPRGVENKPLEKAYFQIQQFWVRNGIKPGFYSDCVFGGNLSVKRSLLGDLRFDGSLVYGGTETDFVFRLVSKQQQVRFIENLEITHHSSLGLFSFCKKAYFQGAGSRILKDRNYHGVRASFPVERWAPSGLYSFLYSEFFLLGQKSKKVKFDSLNFCTSIIQIGIQSFARESKRFLFRTVWNFLEIAIFSNSKK